MSTAKQQMKFTTETKVRALVADHNGELVQSPNITDVTRYNPYEKLTGHGLRGWFRFFQIIYTFALYHFFVLAYHKGWFLGRKEESEEKHLQWQGQWLTQRLLKLGPTFIKIGQAMATRADLLPLAYIKELSTLQDNVPAFPNEVAYQIIQRELGAPVEHLYAEFEPTPVAAASLGQVYRAKLETGEVVAVKVQRPNLDRIINFDLAILRRIVRFMERIDASLQ